VNESLSRDGRPDRGSALILVLVLTVISALIVLPIMTYTMAVIRAGDVEIDKAQGIESAEGGFRVAIGDSQALYEGCGTDVIPSLLPDVTVTCEVVATAAMHPASEVPYTVAVVQADAVIPPTLVTSDPYANPNTAAQPDAWLATPDYSYDPQAGKIWLPELPTVVITDGDSTRTAMQSGTMDPLYTECDVLFPGTYDQPVILDRPTYFVSGVYYFKQPVTVTGGADVVVGDGAAGGCTTDFEASANVEDVPYPINRSGLGGTLIFGGNGRLVIDGGAGGDIRLVINQRYVGVDEQSIAASEGVSIISVNGDHQPPVGSGNPAADLNVAGVIRVPPSRVDDPGDDNEEAGHAGDDPFAVVSGYTPSVLTPKPTQPAAPTNVHATAYRVTGGSSATNGRATVTWDEPNNNGSLITSYVVSSDTTSQTCTTSASSPAVPSLPPITPLTSIRRACTVSLLSSGGSTSYRFRVVAANVIGDSPNSGWSETVTPRSSPPASLRLTAPAAPAFNGAPMYSDGMVVQWAAPPASPHNTTHGYTPINHFEVVASLTSGGAPVASCTGWWNETGCRLTLGPIVAGTNYFVQMRAVNLVGNGTYSAWSGPHQYTPGSVSAPLVTAPTATVRVPQPIIEITLAAGAAEITIPGYIAVPQGRVRIDAGTTTASKAVTMSGGLVAAQLVVGTLPDSFQVDFENPIAQKTVKITSTTSGDYSARGVGVVQINKSGSVGINSWFVQ
jgi:hypothetical protein